MLLLPMRILQTSGLLEKPVRHPLPRSGVEVGADERDSLISDECDLRWKVWHLDDLDSERLDDAPPVLHCRVLLCPAGFAARLCRTSVRLRGDTRRLRDDSMRLAVA